jgi:hypothetical protein
MTCAAVICLICWIFLHPDKIAARHAVEAEVLP